jgi:uncharacterized membrane protein YtjA (UPF0391 family)
MLFWAAQDDTRMREQARGRRTKMLYYAAVFFIIAIIAAVCGFTGIAAGAAGIARILFFLFLIGAVIALLVGGFGRAGGP